MKSEWILAVAIFALPLLVFGTVQLALDVRRRRDRAVAERFKGPPPSRRRMGRLTP